MMEIKDSAIRIFGKEIPLPADSEAPLMESDDSDSSSEKENRDGAVEKVQFSPSWFCVLCFTDSSIRPVCFYGIWYHSN